MRAWALRFACGTVVVAAAVSVSVVAQQSTTTPAPATPITVKDLAGGLSNPARWLTYSGDYSGKRYSPLNQITGANASQLAPQWTFQTGLVGHKFETTPIVVDGVMYATGPMNWAWAIDAKTGRQLWRYQKTLPPAADLRVCCGNVNRGFAILGERLFMTTLDAHLVALDIKTGKPVWDIEMAKHLDGYAGTGAPLIVKDKVIVGIAGGEFAIRGFLDAYDPANGQRLWRFNTIPLTGEPGGDTWPGDSGARGGGPTWQSGSYDAELNTLYWGTGNPNPDFYGVERRGDNLYTNSLVALDPDTGKLKWHYQFTPHDEHDWDSNHVPVLADLTINGQARKVVMVANRNGFFYVLDRTNGQFIHAKPYMKTTWATEIGKDGKPIELPNQRPTTEGTLTCPDLFGGTNFMPPSYSPSTGLFYVSARETCSVFASAAPRGPVKAGDRAMGGMQRPAPANPSSGALRAIDPLTATVKWELKHAAPSWAGVLSTAGGVVFTGDADGYFIAADARTGKELYRYQLGSPVYAAASSYTVDGRQYVVMGSGTMLTAFALPSAAK